jgi:hypothetical protein
VHGACCGLGGIVQYVTGGLGGVPGVGSVIPCGAANAPANPTGVSGVDTGVIGLNGVCVQYGLSGVHAKLWMIVHCTCCGLTTIVQPT